MNDRSERTTEEPNGGKEEGNGTGLISSLHLLVTILRTPGASPRPEGIRGTEGVEEIT